MLSDYKLSSESFQGKNVQALSDRPNEDGLTAAQLKAAFDRSGEEVLAGAVNNVIDCLSGAQGAAQIGNGTQTVKTHLDSRENPHGVTAAQVGAYTAAQTNAQIDAKVSEIGSGDMAQATYDTAHKRVDVFCYADLKEQNAKSYADEKMQQKITVNGMLQGDGTGKVERARARLLWSGIWNSGTITVPQLQNYTMFLCRVSTSDMIEVCFLVNGLFRGIGGFSDSSAQYIAALSATANGNELTLLSNSFLTNVVNSGHGTNVKIGVSEIYGLI